MSSASAERPNVTAPGGQRSRTPQVVAGGGGFFAVDIGKRYKKRPVVRKISLGLRRGEVVGLLGPNGAGKTTCFYMMIGLIAPDHGHVVLDGQDVTELPMY
ncbi:MAG: ATP-binding cassette domain-containing protein, partial [Nitrospira sp.]